MSFLESPPAEDWGQLVERQRAEWLDPLFDARIALLGGGLASLIAGWFLQREAFETVIMVPAETLGGRLTWSAGPVGVVDPATDVLAELGIEVSEESPAFLDRHRLLHDLAARYHDQGGFVVTDVTELGTPEATKDDFEISVTWQGQDRVVGFEELVGTVPKAQPGAPSGEPDNPQEHMVLGTGRRQDGWIQAGYQALPARLRQGRDPMESALILSGRKAAEVVRDRLG